MAERRRRHGAHHARRGQARAGTEQDAIGVGEQAHAGISSNCASASRSCANAASGERRERRPRHADVVAEQVERRLQARHAVGGAEQSRERHELALKGERLRVAACPRELEQVHARVRHAHAEREDAAGGADAHRRIKRGGRAGEHR